MALTFSLTNDTDTHSLHSKTNYGLVPGSASLATPQQDLVWGASRASSFDRLSGFTFRNRTISALIYIRASSLDNWVAAYQNLVKMIYESMRYWDSNGYLGTRCYLDVSLEGMTNATRYDVLAGDVDPGEAAFSDAMTVTTAPLAIGVSVTLTCKPFGRNATASTSDSVALSNGVDTHTVNATSVVGDYDPPTKLVYTAANDLRRLIVWRRSKGTVANFLPTLQAEIASTTGYKVTAVASSTTVDATNVADTSALGASAVDLKLTSNAASAVSIPFLQWEIETQNDAFEGTFRAFLRGQAVSGAHKLQLSYGGVSGDDIFLPTVTTGVNITTYHLSDMGILTLPPRSLPAGLALPNAKIRLHMQRGAGSSSPRYRVDSLHLVPLDEDVLDVEFSTNLTSNDRVVVDALDVRPSLYHTDSASSPQSEKKSVYLNTFFKQRVNAANRFGFLAMDTTQMRMIAADQGTLSLEWHSLHAGFR